MTDCEEWRKNKLKNPKTGRVIKEGGPVYKKLERECASPAPSVPKNLVPPLTRGAPLTKEVCPEFHKDPTKNPITKRKLNKTAKAGIYQQLIKLCGTPVHKTSTPTTPDDIDERRKKLIAAVKAKVAPIIHKADTLDTRIEFANIMRRYVTDVKPCLDKKNNKLYLVNKKKDEIVYFDKRIGRKSVYGEAYMNMGKGFAKLLKFSCKLMSATNSNNQEEVKILKAMSKLAEDKICPNMPITYTTLKCNKKCNFSACPEVAAANKYFTIINELANEDIQSWFTVKHTDEEYESVLMQLVFSIYSFHSLGYIHNDCHLGNFLIHKIKPGGYWRYEIEGQNVFIPNCGYLLVLWDPGLANKFGEIYEDYTRPLGLVLNIKTIAAYKNLIPLPDKVYKRFVPVYNTFGYSYNDEKETMQTLLAYIKNKQLLQHVKVQDKAPGELLNIRPYKI